MIFSAVFTGDGESSGSCYCFKCTMLWMLELCGVPSSSMVTGSMMFAGARALVGLII